MAESFPPDELVAAITGGAISALAKRVAALRARANVGITVVDGEHGPATIVSSEAAEALKLAADFEVIAAEIGDGS